MFRPNVSDAMIRDPELDDGIYLTDLFSKGTLPMTQWSPTDYGKYVVPFVNDVLYGSVDHSGMERSVNMVQTLTKLPASKALSVGNIFTLYPSQLSDNEEGHVYLKVQGHFTLTIGASYDPWNILVIPFITSSAVPEVVVEPAYVLKPAYMQFMNHNFDLVEISSNFKKTYYVDTTMLIQTDVDVGKSNSVGFMILNSTTKDIQPHIEYSLTVNIWKKSITLYDPDV